MTISISKSSFRRGLSSTSVEPEAISSQENVGVPQLNGQATQAPTSSVATPSRQSTDGRAFVSTGPSIDPKKVAPSIASTSNSRAYQSSPVRTGRQGTTSTLALANEPQLKYKLLYGDDSASTCTVDVVVVLMHGLGGVDFDASLFEYEPSAEDVSLSISKKTEELVKSTGRDGRASIMIDQQLSRLKREIQNDAASIRDTVSYELTSDHGDAAEAEKGEKHPGGGVVKKLANPFRSQGASPKTSNNAAQAAPLRQDTIPEKEKIAWLADKNMLPSFLPTARVHGFAFDLSHVNTKLDFDSLTREFLEAVKKVTIDEAGRGPTRSIIFIGHGYGTVLIQQLLCPVPAPDRTYVSRVALRLATAAIVFFAPPTSAPVKLNKWIESRLRRGGGDTLQGLSGPLQTAWNAFRPIGENPNIFVSIYVDSDTNAADFGRVNPTDPLLDASAGIPQLAIFEKVSATISHIAQFSGPQDKLFQALAKRLKLAVDTRSLHRTAEMCDEKTLVDLIDSNIDVTLENKAGQTALHVIAHHENNEEYLATILSTGCMDLEHCDTNGMRPLHAAIVCKNVSMVSELLKAGANRMARTAGTKISALDLATQTQAYNKIKNMLKRAPLVEGLPRRRHLRKGKPPNADAEEACKETEAVLRNIFYEDGLFDKHVTEFVSVEKLIYSDQIFETFNPLPDVRNDNVSSETSRTADSMEAQKLACRWCHIPANNMAWIEDLFVDLGLQMFPWPRTYRERGPPHSRCMNPQVAKLRYVDLRPNPQFREVMALMMPIISYEEITRQQTLSEFIQSIYQPSGDDKAPDLATENKFQGHIDEAMRFQIKGYLKHNPPFHIRRTLDQSYYYMLSNTAERDADQVVSRQATKEHINAKSERKENVPKSTNLLMVDQLWLWIIKDLRGPEYDLVITCFPEREGVRVPRSRAVDDLQDRILKNLGDSHRECIKGATDLVSRILTVCCKTLDTGFDHVPTVEFLRYFQSAIGAAEEEETQLFAEFRRITNELYGLHDKHRHYQKLRSDKLKSLLDIRKECKLLKEIKDVLDEIKMIRSVLTDQRAVLNARELSRFVLGDERLPTPFVDAKTAVESMIHSFEMMETHAKDVENSMNHLLDLKQMQANLWESRSSREGAEATADQGATVLVFTVVTIVFLPLSFMSSFFAIAISQFPKDSNGVTAWPLATVCGWLFGISFAVSIPLLLVAFNINLFTTPWTIFRHVLLRNAALAALKPLRYASNDMLKEKAYQWYLSILDSRNEYDTSISINNHAFTFKRWIEGIRWKLRDSDVWHSEGYRDILRVFKSEVQTDETPHKIMGSLMYSLSDKDSKTFTHYLKIQLGPLQAYKLLASETQLVGIEGDLDASYGLKEDNESI